MKKPLSEVRQQIVSALKSPKIAQAREAYLAKLRQQSSVKVLLEPPRLSVKIGDASQRGPSKAPVTLVEFSDFQCPFCRRVQPTLAQILAKCGDQVNLEKLKAS